MSNKPPETTPDDHGLGKLIWETSRADEGTISVAGANIIAQAILASDFVAKVRADAVREVDAPRHGTNRGYVPSKARVKSAYIGWAMTARGLTSLEAAEEFDRFTDNLQAPAWDQGLEATVLATVKLLEIEEDNPGLTQDEIKKIAPKPRNPYRRNDK